MKAPAAAARAVRWAALVCLLGAALAVLGFQLGLRGHHQAVNRATAFVTGTVVETGIGDEEDIRVRWRDEQGRERTQRFGVYESYEKGEGFAVRYDPHHPEDRAYPADPEESDTEDGYILGTFAGVLLPGLLALGLWVRLRWWRRAVRREPTTVEVVPLRGHFNAASSCWLRVGGNRWQMVMWDPALDGLAQPLAAEVHGDLRRRRRVAPVLAGGHPLVPCGRLRHKEPGGYLLEPWTGGGGELAEVLVVPAGAVMPTRSLWWRTPALWAGLGGLLGLGASVLFAHLGWVSVGYMGLAAPALGTAWAYNGGEP